MQGALMNPADPLFIALFGAILAAIGHAKKAGWMIAAGWITIIAVLMIYVPGIGQTVRQLAGQLITGLWELITSVDWSSLVN